jgi:hypothetical protein
MKILIYRSNDVNIRKNSLFTEEIVEELSDYDIEITMEEDSEISLQKIKEADLIFVFSHGSDYALYHKLQNSMGEEIPVDYEILISTKKNLEYLNNKKVVAFACYTAIEYIGLADAAVENANCITYLGFEDTINRNLPQEFLEQLTGKVDLDIKNFISSVYSSVFKKTIIAAIKMNLTFEHFAKILKLSLKQQIAQQILHHFHGKINLKYHIEGAKPVNDTANSIKIKGDPSATFLEVS